MKTLKIYLFILIPAITAGVLFTAFYHVTGSYLGHIHDVYASNTRSGLVPLFWIIAGFLGAFPMFFYMSALLFSPVQLSECEINQAAEVFTSVSLIEVGQIITQVGTNCRLRVKAIRNTLFDNADFSKVEYCLQFSF